MPTITKIRTDENTMEITTVPDPIQPPTKVQKYTLEALYLEKAERQARIEFLSAQQPADMQEAVDLLAETQASIDDFESTEIVERQE